VTQTFTNRPPGPWDANTAPTPAAIYVPTRTVNERSEPDAAFGDLNQAARNAAARVDAAAAHAQRGSEPYGPLVWNTFENASLKSGQNSLRMLPVRRALARHLGR